MSEVKLIKCRCALTPGGAAVIPPATVCPVPHDRWFLRLPMVQSLSEPYPCLCNRRGGCSPNWCSCAGRVDVESVPDTCCARNGNTPEAVARAVHGGDYRPCWCKGDLERHEKEIAPTVAALIPDLPDDDEEED